MFSKNKRIEMKNIIMKIYLLFRKVKQMTR